MGKRRALSPDVVGVATLLCLIGIAGGFVWSYDQWLADWDKLAQFIPWFGYIGDRLSSGELPIWNPHEGAGQPFIGAPASGWLSIPIMICFTFVDVITGYKLFVIFHMLLGGLGTYAFCRVLGMQSYAALVSGSAYAVGPLLYSALRWEAASGQVLMFVPIALLSVECALRSPRLSATLAWSGLAGLAVCQMYVSSIPRVIYPVLLIAAWMAWRLFIDPVPESGEFRKRFARALIVGCTLSIAFAGVAAAAILPQFEYNGETNVAGAEYDVPNGNYTGSLISFANSLQMVFRDDQTFGRTRFASGAVLVLAIVAIFGHRHRFGVPIFTLMTLAFIDFPTAHSVVRPILWAIPGVEDLTSHRPMSANAMTAFTLSILAGAGAQWLTELNPRRAASLLRLLLFPFVALVFWYLRENSYFVGWWQISSAGVAIVVTLLWVNFDRVPQFQPGAVQPIAARALLLVAILLMPTIKDFSQALSNPDNPDFYYQSFLRIESEREAVDNVVLQEDPGTAAGFLQAKSGVLQPFRIASWTGADFDKQAFLSQTNPTTVALVTNGRPMRLDLQQVYSYNPSQVQTLVEYLEVLNGREQDYHFTEILGSALNQSPLLDMLNVKYVLVPAALNPQPAIARWATNVYQDDQVIVYENPYVFGRAWIVHDVRPSMDGEELNLINTGQVDGRTTAFVDGEIPAFSAPVAGAAADVVTVTSYEPETIKLTASTSADGLLVLSEIHIKGWNAYVDGERVDVLRTNHTLRGVPISAGSHDIELRYEPQSLKIGLATTGVTSIALIGIWVWAGLDKRSAGRGLTIRSSAQPDSDDREVE